jgi:uncharacterized membrane protein YesL
MIGFLIKKTFFDFWDNFFRIVFINLGFLVILLITFGLAFGTNYIIPSSLTKAYPLINGGAFLLIAIISFSIIMIYTGAASCITKDIADHETPGFKDFFKYLKRTYKTSLLFALANIIIFCIVFIASRYYFETFKNLIGLFLIFFIVGIYFYWFTASFYFFPLQSNFGPAFIKNIKKSFILFFDNTIFSLFALVLVSLILMVASVLPPIALLLGPGSIMLWGNVALKLRLYKYDYLEEHPAANRKKIPWDSLLVQDKEKIGKRTLKGFIFPWKE